MEVEITQHGARDALKRVWTGIEAFRAEHGWTAKFEERLTASRLKRAISGIAGCDPQEFVTNFKI
jgi:hypothetical protein